uniref:rRNA-processing protein UTP23 homolog n=1 Tax=Globodera pallida TaxID=36090 RepID=A0A183BWQ5_GLOPA
MYATWNFLKRHRGKIAAGLTVVGTLYSTKKLLETNAVGAYINSVKKSIGVSEAAADGEVEECLVEARRHFLFDVHQQSCDKSLRMIIAELKSRIAIRFNTEELLDELRSSTELTTQRKIEIWEQLKVRSVSRLVSLVTVYPLTILVLKSQKSIVCQQLCHSAHNKATRDEGSSIFSHGVAFVNSFLCSDQNSGRIQQTDELTGDLTELFNNAIAYFQEDGVALLMGIIERIVCQIFDKVSLGEQLNAKDFLFLIERVNLANFGVVENAHLRILLQHLTDVVKSRDARRLTKQFGGQYLEEAMKFLDEAPLLAVSLPMAKIVPILCDAFDQIGATDYGSTFHTILSSTELHRFTLFVSDCSKRETRRLLQKATGTSIICGPMKVKRLKRAAHILTFYRYNFRFYPPFSVLLDGTFCQAALQYKINLREQMPKYLAQSVEMSVTKCVLNELEQLGKPLHGALVICQQFRVAFCPHKPMRTASKCIAHLARRSRDEGNPKYIVGTQDDELMGELRNFGGVPILSIRFNTILLEQPSEESKIIAENKPSEELERVKELKNEATTDRSSTIYLVVGKANGETVFFPTDRTECVSKFENEEKVPISAIASGDLRNLSKPELVTITTSGTLTSLSFPCGAANGPVCLYAQQLYPNICSAELLDIDRDGLVELVVVMTDRVVRSYRYVEELARMIPLNKWEMPTHISGWKNIIIDGHHQQQTTIVDPSTADRPSVPPPLTQLVVPKRPFAVHLLHSMAQRIALVDEGSKPSTEVELHNPDGADIACACATTLSSQLRIVVTVDSWGQLSIYAWRDGDQQQQQKSCEPVVSCRVMRDADHVCCCGGPRTYDERLFVGVVNVFNRVAILSVDLGHIFHEN